MDSTVMQVHSYGCRDGESVEAVLPAELNGVLNASRSLSSTGRSFILPIGATPTAHSINYIKGKLPLGSILELHAGKFPTNNLQQVSTTVVDQKQQAVRVLADVCSVYPERNEALVNAEVITLSRETSASQDLGRLSTHQNGTLSVCRRSGILGLPAGHGPTDKLNIQNSFRVGQKVTIYCQHSCITAAAFHVYYVVDEHDVVCDTRILWKGW